MHCTNEKEFDNPPSTILAKETLLIYVASLSNLVARKSAVDVKRSLSAHALHCVGASLIDSAGLMQ